MTSWVRLWHDMPTDPKWRVIARKSGRSVSEVMAVFTFAMVNASANASERGRTNNLLADDLGAALDMDEVDVQSILDAMEGKVMQDGRLTGWDVRQPKREDNSASRAKAWREEKKVERSRTQPNAAEHPDTDSEPDADTKKKERTKNIISVPEGVSETTWADWIALRKSKRATVSKSIVDGITASAASIGWTLQEALAKMCERGWQGFEPSWVESKKPQARKMSVPI